MQQGLVERFRLLREALEGIELHNYADVAEFGLEVEDGDESSDIDVGVAGSDVETTVHDELYTLLGLKCTSVTVNEIQAGYRQVSRRFHPDRYPTDSQVEKEDRHKGFLEISNAKDILTCPILRPIYDIGGMPAVALHRAASDSVEIDAVPMDKSFEAMSYEEEIPEGNRGLIIICEFI